MKYDSAAVWESRPGIAIVQVTISDKTESRTVVWSADADDLEVHAEKCLQVAREMRRRKGAP